MSRRNQRPQREKSRIAAAIFAFILGTFGAHKFYLRNASAGIFYVMLGIFASRLIGFPISIVLGILDGMRLLTMSEQEFDRRYNRHIDQETTAPRQARRPTRQSRRQPQRAPATRKSYNKVNPFKKSGIKKYKEYELEGAIEDFNKGLEISPDDIALHFNLACAYSLTENKDKGFYHLSRAVKLGFKDKEKIKTHDDLAYLRIQPEFEDFENSGFAMEKKNKPSPHLREQPEGDDVLLSQLNRLAELRKKGLLSEDEFVLERKKLLRR